MGKKAANAPKEAPKAAPNKVAPKEAAKAKDEPKASGKKSKAAKKQAEQESEPGFLSQFRPAPRPIFFSCFVVFCVLLCAFYDSCAVKGKRKDCGYPGITPLKCRTLGCFQKGGGSIGKKTVKIKRKEGASLGIELAKAQDGFVVEKLSEGAVKEHNDALPAGSEDLIREGTRIFEVDKSKGTAMQREVSKTKAKTVEIEINVNRVPWFLMWLESKEGKPTQVEKLLTSPGTQYFARSWAFLAKIGGACWLVSGYPLASLPTYMTISAAVSFYLSRCCHDEKVAKDEPHCFKGRREPIAEAVNEAWGRIRKLAESIAKDPRSYFDWLFVPEKGQYSFLF